MNHTSTNLSTTLISFTLIILMFAAALWLLKRGGASRLRSGGALQVIDRYDIGPNQSLLIVKVAGQCLLIGVAAQSISLVSALDGDLPALEAASPARTGTAATQAFATLLARFQNK